MTGIGNDESTNEITDASVEDEPLTLPLPTVENSEIDIINTGNESDDEEE